MNHHERDGVLPIAFSFSHYIQAQDQSISVIFGKHPPRWATGGWLPRWGWRLTHWVAEETVAVMQNQRLSNLDAWKEYQAQVIGQTTKTLETITGPMLEEVVTSSAAWSWEGATRSASLRYWSASCTSMGRATWGR